jgi:hypothetical protein
MTFSLVSLIGMVTQLINGFIIHPGMHGITIMPNMTVTVIIVMSVQKSRH